MLDAQVWACGDKGRTKEGAFGGAQSLSVDFVVLRGLHRFLGLNSIRKQIYYVYYYDMELGANFGVMISAYLEYIIIIISKIS